MFLNLSRIKRSATGGRSVPCRRHDERCRTRQHPENPGSELQEDHHLGFAEDVPSKNFLNGLLIRSFRAKKIGITKQNQGRHDHDDQ